MPDFKPYTTRQLGVALQAIEQAVYTVVGSLDIHAWCTHEPVPFAERRSGAERTLAVGDSWGGLFDSAWFHFTGRVPAAAAGHKVVLLLDVNGEMCVFDEQGVPVRGLTNASSTFDYSLGRPGKRVLPLVELAHGGEPVDVWADAGCNDLFGELKENGAVKEAAIATVDETVRGLYYDFEVLLDFLGALPVDTPLHQQILTGLTGVVHLIYQGIPQAAGAAACAPGAAARPPRRRPRPAHQRGRPRPHGPGLALADTRDHAQERPHLCHRPGPDGALSRLRLRGQPAAAVPVDEGAPSGPLRADDAAGA